MNLHKDIHFFQAGLTPASLRIKNKNRKKWVRAPEDVDSKPHKFKGRDHFNFLQGSMLVSILFLSILFVVMVSLRFMLQWPLLQREISDSIFSFSAFFAAENFVSQCFAVFLPLMFSVIAYPLFGLQKSAIKWITFYLVLSLEASVCLGVGYFVRLIEILFQLDYNFNPAAKGCGRFFVIRSRQS